MSCLDGGSLLGSRGGALRGGEMVGAAVYHNEWRQALIGVERDLPPYVCGGHEGDTCDRINRSTNPNHFGSAKA